MALVHMNRPLSREKAEEAVRAVEAAIDDGAVWPPVPGGHDNSAFVAACAVLGLPRETLRNRLHRAHALYGLAPKGVPMPPRQPREASKSVAPPRRDVPEVPADPVQVRRLKDELVRVRTENETLTRRAMQGEDWRESILGLTREPLKPRLSLPRPGEGGKGGRTIIAHLSDVHRGEAVSMVEMDGFNAYSSDISRARLGRFFARIAALATEHWSGDPPDEIIMCFGGDMLSGNIHAELMETNDAAIPRAVRELAEDLAGGLVLLAHKVGVKIRVYTVPGNHSRLTLKSQAKRRAAHNLDMLVSDFVEAAVRGARLGPEAVEFYGTESPDAYFSTYRWNWLLTHGDAMGVGGGKGYIGPIAPITKGHRLLKDTSFKAGKVVHYVLTGHYHTTARTSFGWANGSVVGYGEYARDLRADPEPAKQNMLVVHERHGVISHQEIYLGVPEEGSLYAGPASLVRG